MSYFLGERGELGEIQIEASERASEVTATSGNFVVEGCRVRYLVLYNKFLETTHREIDSIA